MTGFNDNAKLCITGHGGFLDIDYFRPEDPCIENWIDWGDGVPIIGMIDAPDYVPGGCCFADVPFGLGDGREQLVVSR